MMSPKNPVRMNGSEWQRMAEWHVLSEWQRPPKGGLDEQKPTGSWPQLIPSVQSHETSYYSPEAGAGVPVSGMFQHIRQGALVFLAWAWTARNVCSVGCCVDIYI